MDENIVFWDGNPSLEKIKQDYKANLKKSNSKVKEDCEKIADLIQADINRCNKSLEYNLLKKFCILYYCKKKDKDKDEAETIQGIAKITKEKNGYGVSSIYIDNLSGFEKGGSILLENIIKDALTRWSYNYVYLDAAGNENGKDESSATGTENRDNERANKSKKLIEYYLSIAEQIPNICVKVIGRDIYYYTLNNERYIPER